MLHVSLFIGGFFSVSVAWRGVVLSSMPQQMECVRNAMTSVLGVLDLDQRTAWHAMKICMYSICKESSMLKRKIMFCYDNITSPWLIPMLRSS